MIYSFAKEYSPKGLHRIALKDYKINMSEKMLDKLINGQVTLDEVMNKIDKKKFLDAKL